MSDNDNNVPFMYRASTKKMLWFLLIGICVMSVAAQFFIKVKPYVGYDSTFGFFAALGFFACAALVLIAKILGHWIKVDPEYYDDE